MDEKVRAYVESQCYEVLKLRMVYLCKRSEFLDIAEKIRDSNELDSSLMVTAARCANELVTASHEYENHKFVVSQISHVSGNADVFVDIVRNTDAE